MNNDAGEAKNKKATGSLTWWTGRRHNRGERGSTLLEVLIVAVVLLVGIFTVIRVFPVGFDVVDRGGQITMASRYAQTLLSDLTSNPATLPDGIIPAVYLGGTSGWPINDESLRPDDLESQAPGTGPTGLQNYRNSLVQFRKIHQETARVPRASAGNISRYVLRFAPIEYYGSPQGTQGYYDLLTVYSLRPFTRVDKEDLDRYDNRDGYYAVDPDEDENSSSHTLWFSGVNYQRTFKVDFSMRDSTASGNPDTDRFTDKIVLVPASSDGSMVQAQDYTTGQPFQFEAAGQEFIWGSEQVRRRFRDTSAEADSNDPYSYKLVNNTLGVLEFNGGAAGTAIGIDYSLMDWQILHDDIDVPVEPDPDRANLPAGEQRAWVKLSFPFIDTTAIGAPGDTRQGIQQAIIIQNIDPNSPNYGMLIDPGNGNGTWSFEDTIRQSDESRAGRIGLLVSQLNQTNAEVRRIRIFYRTLDGFAAQVIKPFASYTAAEWWANTVRPGYNRYVRSGGLMYFALCDVGKAVSVDYTYMDSGSGALRKVIGEMHTIQESKARAGIPEGVITLNVPGGDPLAMRSVDSVRGMSLEVRVTWAIKGTPNRMYDILNTGWGNTAIPSFWTEDGRGRLQVVRTTAAVAKPRDL